MYILSNTLTTVPEEVADKAFLIKGSLDEVLLLLSNKGIHTIYIDGGKLITSFLKEDLIDECRSAIHQLFLRSAMRSKLPATLMTIQFVSVYRKRSNFWKAYRSHSKFYRSAFNV